jgi:hypothetical protein
MKTVVVLGHEGMGHGDNTLGTRILGTFLSKSPALQQLQAVVLFNSGVKLATEGSPVLPQLHQLFENGVDILPCGTCLDHFGLREQLRVSRVVGMEDIIAELNRAEKVITL